MSSSQNRGPFGASCGAGLPALTALGICVRGDVQASLSVLKGSSAGHGHQPFSFKKGNVVLLPSGLHGFLVLLFKFYLVILRERGKRERTSDQFPPKRSLTVPQPGPEPATQARTLTGCPSGGLLTEPCRSGRVFMVPRETPTAHLIKTPLYIMRAFPQSLYHSLFLFGFLHIFHGLTTSSLGVALFRIFLVLVIELLGPEY